jgi:DNA-binding PadR family transcriptional regulator
MNVRTAIIRDLAASPSTKRDLAARLSPHNLKDIDSELAGLEEERLIESITARETIQIYRLTEKGFQQSCQS